MNKVILSGRLTRDPEITYKTNNDSKLCIARYTLAVNRRIKQEGQPDADFINCVAFGKLGELAEKYYKQGLKLVIEGRIQTSKYEKDGTTKYSTNIVVESAEFAESKKTADNKQPAQQQGETLDGFTSAPDDPFNY